MLQFKYGVAAAQQHCETSRSSGEERVNDRFQQHPILPLLAAAGIAPLSTSRRNRQNARNNVMAYAACLLLTPPLYFSSSRRRSGVDVEASVLAIDPLLATFTIPTATHLPQSTLVSALVPHNSLTTAYRDVRAVTAGPSSFG